MAGATTTGAVVRRGLQHRQLLFALNCYLAVVLALFVSLSLDLPNPWWAMLSVFLGQPALPTQPVTGAIWARAIYRAAGTAIGCAAALIIVPNLSGSSELLILAVAGWVAFCVYVSVLDRTPRAYVFVLGGFTMALIGLPFATDPTGIFNAVVGRCEEILIGVVSGAVVQSLLFPRSAVGLLNNKIDQILNGAQLLMAQGVEALTAPPTSSTPRSLAIELTEMNLVATNLRFEGEFSRAHARLLRALEQRLVEILPLTTAIEDRLRTLTGEGQVPSTLPPLMSRVSAWVRSAEAADQVRTDALIADIRRSAPELAGNSGWSEMLLASLAERLEELVADWNECLALSAALRDQTGAAVRPLIGSYPPRPLHVDHGVAALSSVVTALTVIALGALVVAIHWETGFAAIGVAAALCSLFAAPDDPTPMARRLLIGFVLGLPLAGLYEFAVLPLIDGFVLLAIALFPVCFAIGFFFGEPKYAIVAVALSTGFSTGLALQPSFQADFPTFLNTYLALIVGAAFGLVMLSLARVLPIEHVIRRILRAGWRDLAELTGARKVPDRGRWTSRMLDRVGLLLPRLAAAPPDNEWKLIDALRDLRLGVSIIDLRMVFRGRRAGGDRELEAVLSTLQAHFRSRAAGVQAPLPLGFTDEFDRLVQQILLMDDPSDRFAGAAAATAVRRNLCPNAGPYQSRAGAG